MPVFELYKYGSNGEDLFKQADVEAETFTGAFYNAETEDGEKYVLLDTVGCKFQKFETKEDGEEVPTFEPPAEPEPVEEEPSPEPVEEEPSPEPVEEEPEPKEE